MTEASFDPRTGTVVCTAAETTPQDLAGVLGRAAAAAALLAATRPAERRRWLQAVAHALDANRDELARLADRETALGVPRLAEEAARASRQLRFYADVAVEGSYLGVTRDPATAASPALVRVNRPLGPVAVFGASNFPLAFGVLGNDSAAALAAGCPVVAKAHPAHLGLSLRLAELAGEALAGAGAPEGGFGVVVGHATGTALVRAPEIAAVAFTGSQAGGLTLWRLANERDEVIPVFAEMGTVNPVVVTRDGAADRGAVAAVAQGFVGSFTLGDGQFCTKPGLMLAPAGSGAAAAVAEALLQVGPAPVMVTRATAEGVVAGLRDLQDAGAEVVVEIEAVAGGWSAPAAVLTADLAALARGSRLLEECFGCVVLVCEYASDEELRRALSVLPGSLAATVIAGDDADPQAAGLVEILGRRAGRVTVGDWPTGVACTWAQHHGGPWPATTRPEATSVGAFGLDRFVRPVAFQSVPDAWLPPAARSDNPWALLRGRSGHPDPTS